MTNAICFTMIPTLIVSLFCATAMCTAQDKDAPKKDGAPPASALLKQPVAPDIIQSAVWDGRKMAPFKAIDNPNMVKAAAVDFLADDDYVLGVTVKGESRAYPTRFVWFHHVVNDTFGQPGTGETHVAITYCSVCNTGVRYDPVIDGKLIKFEFFGLYNGIVALCDRETESVILQAEGRVINGPLLGTKFKTGPILDTTWAQWKRLHPDTAVMSPDTPYNRFYSPKDHPEPRGYTHFPAPYFRPTVTRGDLRLPPFDKVLAVTLAPAKDSVVQRRAYPIKALIDARGVVNETYHGEPVAVFYDPESAAAVAVSARLDGTLLTFEARLIGGTPDRMAIFDKETGSQWNIEGLCEAGQLKGKSLERLDCHLSQWYGWSAYFPETSIYGRTDPPMPGDPFKDLVEPKKEDKKPESAAKTDPNTKP